MLELPSYGKNRLPISGLLKLGDLLNIDGPILSLFKDDNSQYYIFYWVDYNASFNRWLVFKVKDENLYHYFNKEISLRDIILFEDKDYIFSVDIDDDLNHHNVLALEHRKLPSHYLPEIKSYYKLPLPVFAKEFIELYEASENYYKLLMRQRSIIFNISPNNTNFARAVTTNDAGGFLTKLTRSITGFIEENFWAKYKDIIQSATDYNRFLNEAKSILSPRLFGLRFGSFEVSVGVDTIKKIELKDFSEWQRNVLPEYEKDVVNIDYNDIKQLEVIAEKYSESAREKIYDPYIKIINNPHYEFKVKNQTTKILKAYHKVDKSKENIVLPPKAATAKEVPKGKKFMNMIIEIAEGQDISEIDKRLLQSGLLFSQQLDELHLQLETASNEELKFYFKSPIQYTFSSINNLYTIYVEDLDLYMENNDKVALLEQLSLGIINSYTTSQNNDENNKIRLFFESVIDHIEKLN